MSPETILYAKSKGHPRDLQTPLVARVLHVNINQMRRNTGTDLGDLLIHRLDEAARASFGQISKIY